jgi:hypothetical protein
MRRYERIERKKIECEHRLERKKQKKRIKNINGTFLRNIKEEGSEY